MKQRKVFVSVYSKNAKFDNLVSCLRRLGFQIIASGGTYLHIKNKLGLPVTHASEITGLKPVEGKENVLDHRVETLCPQIHGALLADEHKHMSELKKLDWPFIDLVICTFYPLGKTMEEKANDPVAINDMVDIGGPTLARSGCKGGRAVVVDENDFEWLLHQMTRAQGLRTKDKLWLAAKAAGVITAYVAMESVFRYSLTRPSMAK